jgi:hypothetical protein
MMSTATKLFNAVWPTIKSALKVTVISVLAFIFLDKAVGLRYKIAISGETSGESHAVLYKNSYLVGRGPVAVFFGHVDDFKVCEMAATSLNDSSNNGSPGLYECERRTRSGSERL